MRFHPLSPAMDGFGMALPDETLPVRTSGHTSHRRPPGRTRTGERLRGNSERRTGQHHDAIAVITRRQRFSFVLPSSPFLADDSSCGPALRAPPTRPTLAIDFRSAVSSSLSFARYFGNPAAEKLTPHVLSAYSGHCSLGDLFSCRREMLFVLVDTGGAPRRASEA